jgi:Histidine kinase-, DNA gyrase B-, and HSP90-like ATPase
MVSRVRSLIDQYRRQGAKALLDQARESVADLIEPLPRRAPLAVRPATRSGEDVLAGVCADIALRDLNLVDSLLAELERMESEEEDPDALARLYRLDHLATRLRRNAENLRVLAGQEAGEASEETASLVDVIRAAISAIEQYPRVEIGRVATLAVVGFAADDVSRLLTELLDNATAQSPPTTPVTVSAHLTEHGSILLRVEDAGIGLPAERMAGLNSDLAAAPALDRGTIEHMGLAVVRRLAAKHGVKVWLGHRAPHGTTASVLLPAELVREAPPVSLVRSTAETRATAETRTTPPAQRQARHAAPHSAGRAAPRTGTPDSGGFGSSRGSLSGGATGGVTPNGLPRRVPTSLRGTSAPPPPPAPRADDDTQFFADLAALDAGEQAARGTLPEDHPSDD